MNALKGLIAWFAGASVLSAAIASFGILLSPATVDGPVVPPISPPGWISDDGAVVGEKI